MLSKVFKGQDWINIVRDLLALIFDPDKKYELIIQEHKERRSLTANAYSWVLTTKLAEKMLIAGAKYSKDEMHAEMIYRYGQPETDSNGDSVFWYVQDGIDVTDYYPYAKPVGAGKLGGKPTTQWMIFRGSHDYTRAEMQVFISGIVAECHEQGIETKTPDEIARLISLVKDDEDE